MKGASTERFSQHIKIRFRKMNPHLDMPSEQVFIELFDTLNEELLAIYLPFQRFQYGDYLYFVLASNDYLHHSPLPMFVKIEFRGNSYEREVLPMTEALSKTYQNMDVFLANSYVSDSPVDIFLDNEDLERWQDLDVKV
jgi:hypothetical protein